MERLADEEIAVERSPDRSPTVLAAVSAQLAAGAECGPSSNVASC
jgi:hypothetical protein